MRLTSDQIENHPEFKQMLVFIIAQLLYNITISSNKSAVSLPVVREPTFYHLSLFENQGLKWTKRQKVAWQVLIFFATAISSIFEN